MESGNLSTVSLPPPLLSILTLPPTSANKNKALVDYIGLGLSMKVSRLASYLPETLDKLLIEIGKTEKNLNIFNWFWFKPTSHRLNSFVFYFYFLSQNKLTQESDFNWHFFRFAKKTIFLQFFKNPSNGISVGLA